MSPIDSNKDKNQLRSALKMLRKGLQLLPNNPKETYSIAQDLLAQGNYSQEIMGVFNEFHILGKILLGACAAKEGKYFEALNALNESLNRSREIENFELISAACYSLGNCYGKLGDLENALKIYSEGLEAARQSSGNYTLNLLNNIAVVYSKMERFKESKTYLMEASEKAYNMDSDFRGFLMANIAELSFKMGEIDEALLQNKKALALLHEGAVNTHCEIQCYKTFGKIYGYLGENKLAIESFDKAYELCNRIGDQYRKSSLMMELGRYYKGIGDLKKAEFYLNKGLDLAMEVKADVEIRDIAYALQEVYSLGNNFEKAYYYMNVFHQYFDRIKTRSLEETLMARTLSFDAQQAKQETIYEKEKAQLIENQLRGFHVIAEIGQILTSTFDVDFILKTIYEQTKRLIDVEVIGICILDEKTRMIQYKLLRERGADRPLKEMPLDDPLSLGASCIREKRTIFFNDLENKNMKSVIYFPLQVENDVVGAFTIQRNIPHAFTEKTVELVSVLSSFIAIALRNAFQLEILENQRMTLEEMSQKDAMTHLYNRRYMMELLQIEKNRAIKTNKNFCLVIMDIDHFKRINDTYGHCVGDEVLIGISRYLITSIRPNDFICRWGGEEFMMVLPETDLDTGYQLCEKLLLDIQALSFEYKTTSVGVTVSMGIGVYDRSLCLDELIHQVDLALYRAKDSGRNQVVGPDF